MGSLRKFLAIVLVAELLIASFGAGVLTAESQTAQSLPVQSAGELDPTFSLLRNYPAEDLYATWLNPIYEGIGWVSLIDEVRDTSHPIASGFLMNDSVFVTAGHVVRGAEKARRSGESLKAVFPRLSYEYLEIALENPVLSDDGFFAFYRLSADDTRLLRNRTIHYLDIANVATLRPGQIVLALVPNPRTKKLPDPLTPLIILGVDWNDQTFQKRWPGYEAGADELRDVTFEVAGETLIPGDSGSPVVVFDAARQKFLLVGMVERVAFVSRADALAAFLAAHGIVTNTVK